MPVVAAAKFIHPQQGKTYGKPQQYNGIGSTHGYLAAAAVMLIFHPMLNFLPGICHFFL